MTNRIRIIPFNAKDDYKLTAEEAAKIRAAHTSVEYPGDMIPIETLRQCGITAIHKVDVLSSLSRAIRQ